MNEHNPWLIAGIIDRTKDIDDIGVSKDWVAGARWAEAKLKEKNGG